MKAIRTKPKAQKKKRKVYISRLDRVNVRLPKSEKIIFQKKANTHNGGNISKLVRAAVLAYVPRKSA